jgi:hypothetical protein
VDSSPHSHRLGFKIKRSLRNQITEVAMFKKRVAAAAIVSLTLALALGPALSASASQEENGTKNCGVAPVPYVQVQSTAIGRVNHEAGGGTLGSWNNGVTYQGRYSLTSYTGAYWRVYITGPNGNISYGNAVCHS